jgi:hypothetical protein
MNSRFHIPEVIVICLTLGQHSEKTIPGSECTMNIEPRHVVPHIPWLVPSGDDDLKYSIHFGDLSLGITAVRSGHMAGEKCQEPRRASTQGMTPAIPFSEALPKARARVTSSGG